MNVQLEYGERERAFNVPNLYLFSIHRQRQPIKLCAFDRDRSHWIPFLSIPFIFIIYEFRAFTWKPDALLGDVFQAPTIRNKSNNRQIDWMK